MIATLLMAGIALQLPRATVTVTLDKPSVSASATLTGHISVTFPDGYHAYQNPPSDQFEIPVKVDLAGGSKFKLVKVKYPKGVPMQVPGADKPSNVYTATISIPITLKAPPKAGAATVGLKLSYQQCNDQACLPPDTLDLSAKVTVKAKKS